MGVGSGFKPNDIKIDKFIGTSFDVVKAVYDNLSTIQDLGAVLDEFKSLYYGALSADPVLDPVGGAVDKGDLYFNDVSDLLKVYNGANWDFLAVVIDSIADGDTANAPSRNAVFDALALKAALTGAVFTGDVSAPVFQLTGGSGDQGKMSWNTDEETVNLILNGAVLQLGQELHGHVRNMSGSLIANGTPVMFAGTVGATGRLLIQPMTSTIQATSKFILGLATTDIANNQDGKVTPFGKVRDIDTTGGLSFGGLETWNDEDLLYADAVNDGFLTNVEPTLGMSLFMGVVVNAHATQGTIYVRVTPIDRNLYATVISPTFTGIPLAPTPALDTDTTQISTTAFVLNQASNVVALALGTATAGISERYSRTDHIHTDAIPASAILADGVTATTQIGSEASAKIATTQHVTDKIANLNLYAFQGTLDASTNPNYPAADAGHIYVISVAGKIGGASGPVVEIGDTALCILDSSASGNHATVGANWILGQANLQPELFALLSGAAFTGAVSISTGGLSVDNISEFTGSAGVTIESMLVKVGVVTGLTSLTATTLIGDLTGNADTATTATTASAWVTGRTITLTDKVTGVSGAFDGSGNLSFTTSLAAAQPDITSLGTLTTLIIAGSTTLNSLILNGSSSGIDTIQATAIAGGVTYTWPGADGTSGYLMSTNGSGVLSFIAPGVAAAGSLTGATLASGVTASSLVSFGINPIVGTQSVGNNSTRAASTAYVDNALKNKNTIINGGCVVAQHSQFTCGAANDAISKLTGAVGFGEVNRIRGYTTQTASAGTIDQLTGDAISTTGFGVGFTGVTLAGAGKLHFIHRIKAKDAAIYKGGNGSFSVNIYHDVGSAKTVTIYIRDPDVEDVFSTTSAISNDGGTSINNTTVTTIKYENIDFSSANPERGIEIEIEIDCGAITTKNFKISELQIIPGVVSKPFYSELESQTLALCKDYYRRITSLGVDYFPMVGQVEGTTASYGAFQFPTEMRAVPSLETTGTATDYRIWDDGTGAVVCNVVPIIRNATKSFAQIKFAVASDPGLASANAGSIGFATSSGFLGFIAEL